MIPINIIQHKNAIPPSSTGDILKPFKGWNDTRTGGGWYSKIPESYYDDRQYLPLTAVCHNPWAALDKLGVVNAEFRNMVKYTCPYNEYTNYWGVPVLIFTKDIKTWTSRCEVKKQEIYSDKEYMKKFFPIKTKNGLPFTKIQRSLLGAGYTHSTLVNDGNGFLYDAIVALDNEDYLGVKVWVWINR